MAGRNWTAEYEIEKTDRQVDIYMRINMCGPTCEVFLSELDQGENHAVGHLVGQLGVERVQLEHTKYISQKNIKLRARKKKVPLPNILRDFNLFHYAE